MKFGEIDIDPVEIGINGNAILGIKESGKSYLGTELGEMLFDAGIPFVAFDPIGIWHNLKVPGRGKGYPVVVAGGVAADIPLTVATAPAIVEAAMHQRVSLVLDLFDVELSKADWHKIVRECANLLLHRNAQHGLRHVFIEEAAEFVPQRPMDGVTYAAVEKLIRMGGNARLGCTLITPRSQEVNKAVLELCENVFLFRQRGKLALENLKKWLDVAGAAAKDVMRTLPNLPTGECWAWLGGSDVPVHLHVPPKNSFHPNRRALQGEVAPAKKPVSASKFVTALQAELPKLEEEAKANDPKALRAEIEQLKRQTAAAGKTTAPAWPDQRETVRQLQEELSASTSSLRRLTANASELQKRIEAVGKIIGAPWTVILSTKETTAKPIPTPYCETKIAATGVSIPADPSKQLVNAAQAEDISPSRQAMLDKIAWGCAFFHETSVERQVLAFLLGKHPRTKSVLNDLGGLRTGGFIDYLPGNRVALTELGSRTARDAGEPTGEALLIGVKSVLSKRQADILDILLEAGTVDRQGLADNFDLHVRTKSFLNDLGRMKTLGLIVYGPDQTVVAADFVQRAADAVALL